MILKTLDSRGKLIGTAWKFRDSNRLYPGTTTVCPDPFCDCAEITFAIHRAPEDPPIASLVFDFSTGKGETSDGPAADSAFAAKALNEIRKDDTDILLDIFLTEKQRAIDNTNLDEIEPPPFPSAEIENESLLTRYRQVFPWPTPIGISVDGRKYFVDDSYCLNPRCRCHAAVLDLVWDRKGRGSHNRSPTAVGYDYKAKQGKVYNAERGAHPPSQLIDQLHKTYPDVDKMFSRRHAQLRKLYRNHKKREQTAASELEQPQSSPVGRNDPCPCGSGRKFKKCCGKKT